MAALPNGKTILSGSLYQDAAKNPYIPKPTGKQQSQSQTTLRHDLHASLYPVVNDSGCRATPYSALRGKGGENTPNGRKASCACCCTLRKVLEYFAEST